MPDLEMRTEQFKEAGAKLQELGDKELVLSMRRELRTVGKPVGDRVINAIADRMPRRGGLAERIRSQGRVSMLVDLRRGVRVQLANKAGMFMGAFESGTIRHPVFGNRKTWKAQRVPGGAGAEQMAKEVEALRDEVAGVVLRTVADAL